LGNGNKVRTRLTHRMITPDTITKVVCKSRHTLVITVDGDVYGCGANYQRALGIGDQGNTPTLTRMLLDLPARDIVTSQYHTLILLQDGSVFICGQTPGQEVIYHTPIRVPLPLLAVSIAVNSESCFALLEDDSIYGWGKNEYGQLGVGDTIDRFIPTEMILPLDMIPVSIKGGHTHTLVLMSDGSVYGCGDSRNKELGDEDSSIELLQLMGLRERCVSIIPGSSSTYCITESGDVYGFGANVNLQAGLSSYHESLGMGVKILLYSPVLMMEAGHDEVVFILENGGVYRSSNFVDVRPPVDIDLNKAVAYYFAYGN